MKTETSLIALGVALATLPAAAQNPDARADDSWISISGTVTSSDADSFMLDYGDGLITVEMDDWDSYGDAYVIADGDKVTVYGEVDDDLYETSKIEASSVYVEGFNSYFYANSADEEEIGYWYADPVIALGEVTYIGEVESVNDLAGEFTIDTGASELTVDTTPLLYDPLDDEGYQKIGVGDRVSVDGVIENGFFDGRELEAISVVTIEDDSMGN